MGTIADKLLYLQGTKSAIKDAIVSKGVTVPTGTPFRDYATKIGEISGGGGTPPPVADEWVRPTEWLALPDNMDGVEKVSILNAVFDTDSEFVAFTCLGAYTVDWGDGVVEDYASNVKAEHKYDYSNVNLDSATVAKFGYKQCIITITPQAGNNFTIINLNTFHSSIGTSSSYDLTTGFLDMRINSLNCTTLYLGAVASNNVKHTMLEQCLIGELADTTLDNLFYDCYALQSVSIKDTSNVTNFSSMHYNNYALRKVPQYNYIKATTLQSMFQNCYSIKELPNFNTTTALTNLSSTFQSCSNLKAAPTFDNTSKVTNIGSMFYSCKSLTTSYPYVFGNILAGNFGNVFSYCESLQICPNITTSNNYTSNTNFLTNNFSLKRMLMPLRFTFSVANAKMSANALNEMFSILPTVTGQTVTITGNYGASTCDTSIATARGWTVIK